MKILVIADIYPSKENPVSGVFIKEQVEQLKKHHIVSVMVINRIFIRVASGAFLRYIFRKAFNADKAREEGVFRVEYPVFILFAKPLHIFNGICACLTAFAKLKNTGFRPELIYTYKTFPAGYIGWKIGKRLELPVVNMEFQGPFAGYFNEPRLGAKVIKTINNIAYTIYTAFQLTELQSFGARPEKLRLGYFGVDTDKFFLDLNEYKNRLLEIKAGRVKLLVISRLEENKGIRYLIEAMEMLRKEFPYIQLSIIGPMDEGGEALLELIGSKNMGAHILYSGACNNEELPAVIAKHDILVSPSLYETFGVTIIEALSCGKPVVATKCGGPEETVTGEVGLLVEKADPQSLANGIKCVIDNYERYDPEVIRGYAVGHFSQDIVLGNLNKLFEEAARGG